MFVANYFLFYSQSSGFHCLGFEGGILVLISICGYRTNQPNISLLMGVTFFLVKVASPEFVQRYSQFQISISMVIQFYSAQPSSPCRLVHMVLDTIGVPFEMNVVDLAKGEHLTNDFLEVRSPTPSSGTSFLF